MQQPLKDDIDEVSTNVFDSIEAKGKNDIIEKMASLVIELFKEKNFALDSSKSEVYGSLDFKKVITFGKGMNYKPGTKLQVKVTGVTKDGEDYLVEYTIEYASIK